ncbi:MAG: hypothetical protein R3A12_12510 [Ignavibacteria bacterium]
MNKKYFSVLIIVLYLLILNGCSEREIFLLWLILTWQEKGGGTCINELENVRSLDRLVLMIM